MIKTVTTVLTVASLLVMCSPVNGPYVSPELQPAYKEWIDGCKIRNIPWRSEVSCIDSILYDSLYIGYWGKCFGDKIIVSSKSIAPEDTMMLKLVTFHELGHCAFGFTHDDAGIEIMNTYLKEENIKLYQWFWTPLVDNYYSRYRLIDPISNVKGCLYEESN